MPIRAWVAKAKLLASARWPRNGTFFAHSKLIFPNLGNRLAQLQPYDGLANIWHDYASRAQPDYPPFIKFLAIMYRHKFNNILDLGCGSGTLAVRLAMAGHTVVGLDNNPAMIAKAQAYCVGLPGVRFVEGDFTNFQLAERFDLIICGFNSLNHLSDITLLSTMFRTVAAHLEVDGLFVFDAITSAGMKRLSGSYLHIRVGDHRFVLRPTFDSVQKRETTDVFMTNGVERHQRIPIDPDAVKIAALSSRLRVDWYFSSMILHHKLRTGPLCFYVLAHQG